MISEPRTPNLPRLFYSSHSVIVLVAAATCLFCAGTLWLFTSAPSAQQLHDLDYYLEEYISRQGQKRADAESILREWPSAKVVPALATAIITDARLAEPKLRYRTFVLLREHHAYEYGSAFEALVAGLEVSSSVGQSALMLARIAPERRIDAANAIIAQLGKEHTLRRGVVALLSQALGTFGGDARSAFEALKAQGENPKLSLHDRQEAIAALALIGQLEEVLQYYKALDSNSIAGAVIGLGRLALANGAAFVGHSAADVGARSFVLEALSSPAEQASKMALDVLPAMFGEELYQNEGNRVVLNSEVANAFAAASRVYAGSEWKAVLDNRKAAYDQEATARSNLK